MVNLARLSGFDNNGSTQTGALFNQVMVQTGASYKRRNCSLFLRDATVREDEDNLRKRLQFLRFKLAPVCTIT